MVYFKLKLI